MPNMVPINYQHAVQESHLRRLEQQQQQQHQQQLVSAFSAYTGRPIWIPSMVSVPASEPSFLSCQTGPPCPPTATASAPVTHTPTTTTATAATRPMATLPLSQALSSPALPQTHAQTQSQAQSQAQTHAQAQPVPSADEVCAASVLISFTPKERQTVSNVPSPVPNLVNETVVIPKNIREESPGHVTDSCTSSAASASASVMMMMEEDPSVCHSTTAPEVPTYPADQKWFTGCISLSLPEDEEVLSPLHCFMRRYCVEAFTAAPQDVATPRYGKSHGLKVVTGQVGIRCMYCKHRPVGKRPERAVCYPSSLKNIYHSIETWQRRHSLVCPDIPPWVRQSMVELMESSKSRAGGRRQYWEDSATRLGMVDTSSGVRFIREPGAVEKAPSSNLNGFVPKKVVTHEDKETVTDYLFLLMDQMETCQFTEEDRSGGRSKIKNNTVGFPGMQCKHCQGKAGFGRYFPSSVNALALANSDRNINNHLQKCRRCPADIKLELTRLQKDSTQGKNRRGLRKLFFRRVWERMHGPLDA